MVVVANVEYMNEIKIEMERVNEAHVNVCYAYCTKRGQRHLFEADVLHADKHTCLPIIFVFPFRNRCMKYSFNQQVE